MEQAPRFERLGGREGLHAVMKTRSLGRWMSALAVVTLALAQSAMAPTSVEAVAQCSEPPSPNVDPFGCDLLASSFRSVDAGQPFASSVVAQFHNMGRRGDALAARKLSNIEATTCKHQEGIARTNADDGTPYMFVSRSGKDPGGTCFLQDDEAGWIYVVRMGSRNRDGERMHTNLLPLFSSHPADRPHIASGEDDVVKVIRLGENGFPSYMHPGGMQTIGDLLVIGTEDPIHNPGASKATVLFVNVHDPDNPRFIGQLDIQNPGSEAGSDPVGLTVVKDEAGQLHYLLVTAGGPNNGVVRFYRSPALTERNALDPTAWQLVGDFNSSRLDACLDGPDWPVASSFLGVGQHQMFNLVRDFSLDGPLFLLAGRRDGLPPQLGTGADEYLDLYRVNLTPTGLPADCPLSSIDDGVREMDPASVGEGILSGSFSAASSVYVSPSGELMVYWAPHENGDVLRFGQFRALDLVKHGGPLLHPSATVDGPVIVDEGSTVRINGHGQQAQTKAFVQLFKNRDAGERPDNNVGAVVIEYEDRFEYGLEILAEPPGGDTSYPQFVFESSDSLRWFAPPGCTIAATDYPLRIDTWPGPDTVLLRGTGQVEVVSDLKHLHTYTAPGEPWPSTPVPVGVAADVIDYSHDIGGISFSKPGGIGSSPPASFDCDDYYNAPIGLGWDFDNDGLSDASGDSASFSAAQLDGPASTTLTVRAQHPTDTSDLGSGSPVSVPVTVRNVPPVVQPITALNSLGRDVAGAGGAALVGMPFTLLVEFTDKGRADTQTAMIDWGDGTTSTTFDSFSDARGGGVGHVSATHIPEGAGTKTVTVFVTDDDGGTAQVSATVRVLSPVDALMEVSEALTTLIGSAPTAKIAAELTSARDALIGNHFGRGSNGAVDKLAGNDPADAIRKILDAIGELTDAELRGASDLDATKDQLGLITEAIARGVYRKALAAMTTPNAGQVRRFEAVAGLLTLGHRQLVAREYDAAGRRFIVATSKALGKVN